MLFSMTLRPGGALSRTGLAAVFLLAALSRASADPVIVTPSGVSLTTGNAQAETLSTVEGKPRSLSFLTVGLAAVEVQAVELSRPGLGKLAFSAQTQILPETTLSPAVSAGVRDLANSTRSFDASGYYGRAYYLAGTKALDRTVGAPTVLHDFSLTAGVGFGAMRGPFGSVSARMPLNLQGALEYDSRRLNARVALPLGTAARLEYARVNGRGYVGLQLHTPVNF